MHTDSRAIFHHGKDFYGPVMLNPSTLAHLATAPSTWREILEFHHLLATDEYVQYLDAYYREATRRFGDAWFYLDIVNTLYAAAKVMRPRRYLEIGVRRGRSACTVARAHPEVNITAFDLWMPGYAGMDNPGPDFVARELARLGHRGSVEFIDGDSHATVPAYFAADPDLEFDLITVDGDHSEAGALADLRAVIPRLAVGGALVFDDIAHPTHPYLVEVWLRVMQENPQLAYYAFVESGFGVAFALRLR